jgi:hypothetical protein
VVHKIPNNPHQLKIIPLKRSYEVITLGLGPQSTYGYFIKKIYEGQSKISRNGDIAL